VQCGYASVTVRDDLREAVMSTTEERSNGASGDDTTFTSAADPASPLQRAAAAHGEHEKRLGAADPGWPGWYAEYKVAERADRELPT
jgi:hypothetical protein